MTALDATQGPIGEGLIGKPPEDERGTSLW